MTLSYLRNILFFLDLFVVLVQSTGLNVSGEAVTTRFWDCCKPSCSWNGKADFSAPVQDCKADDTPSPNTNVGTGCGEGGSAYTCTDQQPWAVNDTFSYGFAGIFLKDSKTEGSWCCACYELEFTSDPIKGKKMIVQASNSAFDINTANRFSLAIPGGNTTSHDACAKQFGVEQSVFGETNEGVGSVEDCDKLPDQMKDACKWRFDWFQDAQYPSVNFKRVVCPTDLTDKTNCVRNDDKELTSDKPSSSTLSSPTSPLLAGLAMIITGLFSV